LEFFKEGDDVMGGERVTHAEIMRELKHTNKSIDNIEEHLKELNNKVNAHTVAIATMKAVAGTVSAVVSIVVTSIIAFFLRKAK